MSGAQFLLLRDVTIEFSRWGQNVKALDRINLSVPQGQWVIVVGHNGSGKTTMLRAISGMTPPTDGQLLIKEKPIQEMSLRDISETVFHVHQDPLLGTAPSLTVYENLVVADHEAQVRRYTKQALKDKYHRMLDSVGLADRMRQPNRFLPYCCSESPGYPDRR